MFDFNHVNLLEPILTGLMLLLGVLKLLNKHNTLIDSIRELTQAIAQYKEPESENGTNLSQREKNLLIDKLEKVLEELKKDKATP